MLKRLNQLIAYLSPPLLATDASDRARFLVQVWLTAISVFLLVLPSTVASQRWGHVVLGGSVFVLGAVVLLLFRRATTVSPWMVNFSLAVFTLAGCAATLVQRPAGYGSLTTTVLIPLLAAYLLDRWAVAWLGITIAATIATVWLAAHGYTLNQVDPSPAVSIVVNVAFVSVASWAFAARYAKLRQNAIERMVQSDRAKTAFLATISHEIRTPMNGVLGMTEVVLQGELPALQREQLEVVQRSGKLLISLVNDLLDVTRLESGMLGIERGAFDLEKVLADVRAFASALASPKGLNLVFEADPTLLRPVLGDGHRLAQVLNNLISNSVKFTAVGQVTLRVESNVAGRIRFSVSDTGPGVSASALSRLFTLFHQGDNSTTRTFGGSGVGLALSQQLVELMGGHIEVESQPGVGSTFSFSLPLPNAPTTAGRRSQPELVEVDRNGQRVLVVDDNPINLRVAAALMQRVGFAVELARNGSEAFEAVRAANTPFSLVLMDCHMPVMDGFEATERIRALGEPKGATPIIALTASAAPEDLAACKRAGMNDCVTKPIAYDDLKATVARHLGPH